MKQRWQVWAPTALAFTLVLGMYIGMKLDYGQNTYVLKAPDRQHQKINQLIDYINRDYVDEIDTDSLLDKTIEDILSQLDPHSTYIHRSEFAAVEESMQGNFQGIGVEFELQRDTIVVVSPISGGPSEQLGIEAGDRIVIVDVKHNENFWGKKKYALTLGIRKARHTRLLLSDADCKPSGPNWLQNMTGQLNQEKQIVLGYGGYLKKPGLLNALIRFETAITAFQYFSSALLGRPYMGVGRNLSYTSNLFYEHAGFTAHMQIESGDDDLFVNQAATSQNTTVCLTPESFTWSIPKDSWRTWIRQKARHSSTAYLYKPFEKFWLGLYFVSNLAFWLILIIGLTLNWPLFLALGLTRFLFQYLLLAPGFKKLEEGQLLWALPLLELFLVLMQLVIFINSFKTIRWK